MKGHGRWLGFPDTKGFSLKTVGFFSLEKLAVNFMALLNNI